jgi:hypothetical protein
LQKQHEVMQWIMELLSTMEEGLVYIRQKMIQGMTMEPINMFYDVTAAFLKIEQALAGLAIEKVNIQEKAGKLRHALDVITEEYESNKGKRALEIMQLNLEPAFKGWKEEIEKIIIKAAGH